jgi:7-carboxy-7-deazaguanine synthase
LQGEGINIGRPAIFLRTALCNLACSWCDTKYTWDWEHFNYGEQVKEIAIPDALALISKFRIKHLVVTGGEPMLQQNQLQRLFLELKKQGYFLEMETNGTIIPTKKVESLIDQWNVSPKLASSKNSVDSREIAKSYSFFTKNLKAFFKYVINDTDDLNEMELLMDMYNIPPEKIILMSQSNSKDEMIERSRWLARICKERGYILSLRLHVLLWGNQRGF